MEKFDDRQNDQLIEKVNTGRLSFKKPVLGFAAYSGTGKTTLLEKLLPLMKLQGLRVALIKQTHHDFEIDKPGKDSYRLRKAGADQVLLTSAKRSALITEHTDTAEPELGALVAQLDLDNLDLVLVEGFKHQSYDKIELHRQLTNKEFLFPHDRSIVAVACDSEIDTAGLPLLNINIPEEVASFINRWLHHYGKSSAKQYV